MGCRNFCGPVVSLLFVLIFLGDVLMISLYSLTVEVCSLVVVGASQAMCKNYQIFAMLRQNVLELCVCVVCVVVVVVEPTG